MSGSPKVATVTLSPERQRELAEQQAAAAAAAEAERRGREEEARRRRRDEAARELEEMLTSASDALGVAADAVAATLDAAARATAAGMIALAAHDRRRQLLRRVRSAASPDEVHALGRELARASEDELKHTLAELEATARDRRARSDTAALADASALLERVVASLATVEQPLRQRFDGAGATQVTHAIATARAAIQAGRSQDALRAAESLGPLVTRHLAATDRRVQEEHDRRAQADEAMTALCVRIAGSVKESDATVVAGGCGDQAREAFAQRNYERARDIARRGLDDLETAIRQAAEDNERQARVAPILAAYREAFESLGMRTEAPTELRSSHGEPCMILRATSRKGEMVRARVSLSADSVAYEHDGFDPARFVRTTRDGRTFRRCDHVEALLERVHAELHGRGIEVGALDWPGKPPEGRTDRERMLLHAGATTDRKASK